MRRAWMFILTAILLVVVLAGNARADAVKWRMMRTRHFIVYYSERHKATADRAANIAEEWHATLSRKLKFQPRATVPIYLYPERRSFSEATGAEASDTIVGMAHTQLLDIKVDASGALRILPASFPMN